MNKPSLILFTLLCTSKCVFAQWATNGTVTSTTNSVSIGGTVSPATKLEVSSGSGETAFKAVGAHGYQLIDNVGSGRSYYQADNLHQFQGATGLPIMTMLTYGDVGIGTITPVTKLDVSGLFHLKYPGILTYPSDGGTYIGWNKSGGGGETNFTNNISGGNIGGFTFDKTTNGTAFTRLMTILDNGNVGIGNAAPEAKLDINAGVGVTAFKAVGPRGSVVVDNLGSGETYYQADTFHQFQGTLEKPILTMLSSGNVGIGTVAPVSKLDVSGLLHIQYPGILNYGSKGGTYIGWNRSGGGGEANFVNNIEGGNIGGFTFDKTADGITFDRLFTILDNGNVGIGVSDTKGFKLAVNGSALVTSVTVKAYANWPDYVFRSDYKLPSLMEVKSYVDKNHHLPEMPSASSIEKNGLDLGEIVKLQTKKIEELTLYVIEQQLRIDQLKSEQQNRIEKMEQLLLKLSSGK